jgi:hypothetical protein
MLKELVKTLMCRINKQHRYEFSGSVFIYGQKFHIQRCPYCGSYKKIRV